MDGQQHSQADASETVAQPDGEPRTGVTILPAPRQAKVLSLTPFLWLV